MRHGPRSAAFVLGLALMSLDLSQALRNCRVGSGAPAPTRLGEGCHCVPAASGTEELGLKTAAVLRLRVSVAVTQMQMELKLREVN